MVVGVRTGSKMAAAVLLCLLAAGCQTMGNRQTDVEPAVAAPTQAEIAAQSLGAGDAAFRGKDYQRAIYHYMMAAQATPEDATPFIRIAFVHETNARPEAAEQAYRLALSRVPDALDAQEGLGVVLLKQGKSAEASEVLTAVAARDAARWRAQNSLGVISDMKGDYVQARVHYQAAMQSSSDIAQVLNNFGYSYYLSNDWVSAERLFKEAVDKSPKYWPAWSNLGLVRVRQQRYDEAQTIFRQFMAEHEVLNMMGYLCTLVGDYKNAEDFLNRATAASPSYYKEAYDNLDYLRHKM